MSIASRKYSQKTKTFDNCLCKFAKSKRVKKGEFRCIRPNCREKAGGREEIPKQN